MKKLNMPIVDVGEKLKRDLDIACRFSDYEDSFLDLLKEEHHAMREIDRCEGIIKSYQDLLMREGRDFEDYEKAREKLGEWYSERETWELILKKMRSLMREYIDKMLKGEE